MILALIQNRVAPPPTPYMLVSFYFPLSESEGTHSSHPTPHRQSNMAATNGNNADDDAAQYLEAFFASSSTEAPPMPNPLDVARGLTSLATDPPTVHWGIVGAGRVSHDFVQALKSVPGALVAAVAASALDKAQEFGAKHGIPKCYGSYEALAADPDVQVVYIGTLHAFHKAHALLAIEAGKHVLVEKPVACTTTDAEEMVARAQAKGVFFLEGMWTRFFPVVEMARHLIEKGMIGKVVALHADFGFNSSDSENYPDSPFFRRTLGGGGCCLWACTPSAWRRFALGPRCPRGLRPRGWWTSPRGWIWREG